VSNAKENGISRASARAGKRSSSGSRFGGGAAPTSDARFSDVPGVAAVLDAIAAAGCAIHVGATMDNSALVLRLFEGGSSETVYVHDQEQLDDNFAWLARKFGVFGKGA